jgi:hypothetical protein
MASGSGKVEMSGMWTDSTGEGDTDDTKEVASGDHLRAGRFLIDIARKRAPLATAAPGLR